MHSLSALELIGNQLMKLPNLAVFLALIVMICSAPVVAQRTTATSQVSPDPEIVVKEFYEWYIHSVSHQIDPFKAGRATLKKYVTARFIREIDRKEKELESAGFDADYFLEAQKDYPDSPDFEDEWIKNISVSKVVVRGSSATASAGFGRGGELAKERISLIKESGVWKINRVEHAH